MSKAKVLVLDIETSPLISYTWGMWDQNIPLNQIKQDWHVLSWSAKWYEDASGAVHGPHKRIMYMDQSKSRDIEDDAKILKGMWSLLDQADVVITQNGKSFDIKKLNARFILNGMAPTSSFRHIDTLVLAKKNFAFTSNKLEYMTGKLCKKYKKSKHAKFSGFELWRQCLAGNKKAWKELEHYNKYDVLSLEELYTKLAPWDNSIDFNVFSDDLHNRCGCGSTKFQKIGFAFTNSGKFQRYFCTKCKKETRSKTNELSKEKRQSMRK